MKHEFSNIISLAMLKNFIYLEYLVKFICFVLIYELAKIYKKIIFYNFLKLNKLNILKV